jgi:four helix bundle protein
MVLKSHKELAVWQQAMALAAQCYQLTAHFPRDARYELTSQIRRAVVSIPSNIAEGFHLHSTAAYIHHLRLALGSQAELETQLELAIRLNYTTSEAAASVVEIVDHVGRMLHKLVSSLEAYKPSESHNLQAPS